MKKIREIYYTAPKKFKKKFLVNHAISGWTTFVNMWRVKPKQWKQFRALKISHEEIWFPDEYGIFVGAYDATCGRIYGTCFSSTLRDGDDGVRLRSADSVLGKHPDRWKYFEREVTDEDFDRMWNMSNLCASKKTKYDKVNVFVGFTTPNNMFDDENKWYCSQVCRFIKWCGNMVNDMMTRISPMWSAWIEIKAGRELHSLASELDDEK